MTQVNGLAKPPPASTASPVSGAMPRNLEEVARDVRRRVTDFLGERTDDPMLRAVQSQVRTSMGVIEEALGRYKPDELSLAYNGGKDCLVMLILILACLPVWSAACSSASKRETSESADASRQSVRTGSTKASEPDPTTSDSSFTFPERLQAVYVVSKHPFSEVEEFVLKTSADYNLHVSRHVSGMRDALDEYLKERPVVKAIFVGTRRTDPHGELLTHFDPTDAGWPLFMRIHPVIDWHYAEIWAFIRHLNLPFCSLYQRGFTSLGGFDDTHPNPALAIKGDETHFRPAYELMADEEERLGRDS